VWIFFTVTAGEQSVPWRSGVAVVLTLLHSAMLLKPVLAFALAISMTSLGGPGPTVWKNVV